MDLRYLTLKACLLLGLAASPAAAAAEPCRVAVLGDSLTAGFGVRAGASFPAQLGAALAKELTQTAADGRIKLFVTLVALEARRNLREAFGPQGAYIPQAAVGPHAEHVVAFTRRAGEEEVVVVAPRLTAKLGGGRREPPLGAIWSETRLMIAEGRFTNLFTGEVVSAEERDGGTALLLDQVLADFPVALLSRTVRAESRRG